MFGTVIIDIYKKSEIDLIVNAIEELCSPNDTYGWSSAGIYSFWNPSTKEIYYIGLASDLGVRFKQHNGLLTSPDGCSKLLQINNYFKDYDKIGYTIFVQSSLSQPITNRNSSLYKKYIQDFFSIQNYAGEESINFIKQTEGILIETYKKTHGTYPKWNQIGGSEYGQNKATKKIMR